jgi:peptide/nickel transport system permease protein
MGTYVVRRTLLMLPMLIGVSVIIFSILRVVDSDVLVARLGESTNVTGQQIEEVKKDLGLTGPLPVQYVRWVGDMLHGDFGFSYYSRKPALPELTKRIPVTIEFAVLSIVVGVLVGVPGGVLGAIRQDGPADYGTRSFSVMFLSMPSFWLGILFIYVTSTWIHSLSPPPTFARLTEDPIRNLRIMWAPVVILGIQLSAVTMRITRSQVLEVMRQDYIRTAWAKGLRERAVIFRHALKNAMIPVITVIGGQMGFLLGGAVVLETVFALPGVGRLTVNSVITNDYPQIQLNVMFLAVVHMLVNFVVDISYGWFDPRIRYG